MDARIKTGWVTGQELKLYLERELEMVFARDPWRLSGGWGPRASGMTMSFEARESQGNRLKSLQIGGEQVADAKRYSIAGCEREGEPLDVVCRHRGTHDVEISKSTIHEAVRHFLGRNPVVSPRRDGRATAIDLAESEFSQDKILSEIRRKS